MENAAAKTSENVRVNISINGGIRGYGEALAEMDHRGSLSNVIEFLIEQEWNRRQRASSEFAGTVPGPLAGKEEGAAA